MGFYETLLSKKLNKAENLNTPLYDMLLSRKLAEGGGGVEKTVTGKTITITDALAEPMKLADIEILSTQSGSGYADANLYVSPTQDAQDAYIYNIALLYGKNKFDKNMTFKIGYYISPNGKDTPNKNYKHSDYIAVKPSTDYVFSGKIVLVGVPNSVAFYDKDKTFISIYIPSETGKPAQFKTPNNCAYIIFNASKANYFDANTIQLEEGTVATSYEEPMYVYSGHVDLISGLLTVDATPTPQTYQLTPQEISTLEGTNVIWSDANGNTTITYMAKE